MSERKAKLYRVAKHNEVNFTLRQFIENIPDYRKKRGIRYKLEDILLMLLVSFLWGSRNALGSVYVLKEMRKPLKKLFGITQIPSHDTFSRIMRELNGRWLEDLLARFIQFVLGTPEGHIILDGKAVRAASSYRQGKEKPFVPYNLSAFHSESGLVIGQEKVAEKTNEITAIPKLLNLIDIENSTITIDAIGCQKEIVNLILRKNADFILPVKQNQKGLREGVIDILDYQDSQNKMKTYYSTELKPSHGRKEERILKTAYVPQSLRLEHWPDVVSVSQITRKRKIISSGKESIQVVEYISNIHNKIENTEAFIRHHWKIENSLHWVLDSAAFLEDLHNARKGFAVENWGALRKIVFNVIVLAELKYDIKIENHHVYFMAKINRVKEWLLSPLPQLTPIT